MEHTYTPTRQNHERKTIHRDHRCCPDTGLLVGSIPGWPGRHTQGETLAELDRNLAEVIGMLLEEGEPALESEFVGTRTIEVPDRVPAPRPEATRAEISIPSFFMRYQHMTVEELQSAVKRLPAEDVRAFAGWLEEFLADEWDRRMRRTSWPGSGTRKDGVPSRITRPAAARRSSRETLRHPGVLVPPSPLAGRNPHARGPVLPDARGRPPASFAAFQEIGTYWSARVGRDHRGLRWSDRRARLVLDRGHDRYEEKIKS